MPAIPLANAIAAAAALVRMMELFDRTVLYEIKRSWNEDDDEGVRLKLITLAEIRAILAFARGERGDMEILVGDVADARSDAIAAIKLDKD